MHWKRRGQNAENNGGWTSKERFKEASGTFATIDDPSADRTPGAIARRVGSDKAANVVPNLSTTIGLWLVCQCQMCILRFLISVP
jgi:hypothetical protein